MKMGTTIQREKDPKDVGRDLKIEMGAVVAAVVIFITLMFMESYRFGVMWLMAAVFAFGIWRIGKATFR
jgi:hypothetical protein